MVLVYWRTFLVHFTMLVYWFVMGFDLQFLRVGRDVEGCKSLNKWWAIRTWKTYGHCGWDGYVALAPKNLKTKIWKVDFAMTIGVAVRACPTINLNDILDFFLRAKLNIMSTHTNTQMWSNNFIVHWFFADLQPLTNPFTAFKNWGSKDQSILFHDTNLFIWSEPKWLYECVDSRLASHMWLLGS